MTNDTAQILADCLDVLERPGVTVEQCVALYPDQRGSLIELLVVAQSLRSAPPVLPSLDFRMDARPRLIACLPARRSRRARVAAGFSAWGQRFVSRKILMWRAAFSLLIGVALGASVVVASAQSLPNDVLYPVKRTIEQARLMFALDNKANGALRLTFAAERLDEVQRLIDRGRGADAVIAIDDFAAQVQSVVAITHSMPDTAERANLLARVNESIKSSDAVLSKTQEQLPESGQVAVRRARAVLADRSDDHHEVQPPVLPVVSTITPSDRTAAPHSTPTPSRTVPRATLRTPHWLATPVEYYPIHPPIDRPTARTTRQPTALPTNRFPHRTPTPPAIRTQMPFVHPTFFPTIMPSAMPPFVPPQFPTPLSRFHWPGFGTHHRDRWTPR